MLKELVEKRNEFVVALNKLESDRTAAIEAKVLEYRKSLEATHSTEAIDKVKNVISALDELITFEQKSTTSAATSYDAEQVRHAETTARPGMSSIVLPR